MLTTLAIALCSTLLPRLGDHDLLALQRAPTAAGLPAGWVVRPMKGRAAPSFAIRDSAGTPMLRITGRGAAAWAMRQLEQPKPVGNGALSWRWRVLQRPDDADLRQRHTDDSPLRIAVLFGKPPGPFGGSGRVLFYTWGGREPEGFEARSFPSDKMHVIRVAGDAQLGGDWHDVTVRPFDDFRRRWKGTPPSITAVGIMQDTDATNQLAIADLRALVWTDGATGVEELDALP